MNKGITFASVIALLLLPSTSFAQQREYKPEINTSKIYNTSSRKRVSSPTENSGNINFSRPDIRSAKSKPHDFSKNAKNSDDINRIWDKYKDIALGNSNDVPSPETTSTPATPEGVNKTPIAPPEVERIASGRTAGQSNTLPGSALPKPISAAQAPQVQQPQLPQAPQAQAPKRVGGMQTLLTKYQENKEQQRQMRVKTLKTPNLNNRNFTNKRGY